MALLVNAELILLLLYRLNEEYGQNGIEGRTKVQKIIYLISRNRPIFNFSYIRYHYGPYSKDLQQTLANLSAFDLIREEVEIVGSNARYNYRITNVGSIRAREAWEALTPELREELDQAFHEASELNELTLEDILPRAYEIAREEGLLQ